MAIIKKILQGVLGLKKDPNATTQDTAVIQAEDTNSGIAIVPNGNGAITASIPDGTAAGGNARGDYAVDLQTHRDTQTKVASGSHSVILGGYRNRSEGVYSISAGENCRALQNNSLAIGSSCEASAAYGIALGSGARATSSFSTVSGGLSNTASTGTHATVVGGNNNTSSGQYSISGGNGSNASGAYSLSLGRLASASGTSSYSFGYQTNANKEYSFALGRRSVAYLRNQISVQSVDTGGQGQTQYSTVIASKNDTLNSAATTVLSLDGTGTTNLIIPTGTNRVWNVVVDTTAVVTAETAPSGIAVGDVYSETTKLTFKKIGGVSSLVGILSQNAVYDGGMDTATMNFSVGSSKELKIEFQAPTFPSGDITVRVVSKVSLVEVAY